MPIDVSGFEVPATPRTESEGLARLNQNMWRNRQWQYQLQREKEQEEWRKLHLIQGLTDLSQHQTGSDVANAIGNKQASDVLQEFTAAAGNMSPAELQAKVAQKMNGVITGMDATKNELDQADKQMSVLKQQFPELDMAAIAKDYRADILHRRLKNDSEFVNPMEVQPSQFDVTNPSFLSKYVTNTKKLDESIQNPKGLDAMAVASGDEYNNVVHEGKVPFWMKTNYTEDDLKKGGGFLKRGFVPQLSIKSEDLPTDALPSLRGEQRKMVTSDVHKQFRDEFPLQVAYGTRQMFGPKYDEMTDNEKELAERDYLHSKIKGLDKSGFMYKSSTHPSAAQNKIFMGDSGKGGEVSNIRNIYGEISGKSTSHKGGVVPLVDLSTGAQSIALKQARDLTGDNNLGQDDIYVRNQDGKMMIVKRDENTPNNRVSDNDEVIGEMDFAGANIPAQVDVKAKRNVVTQSTKSGGNYHIKGKNYSEKELLDMGYKLDQIAPYKQ